MGAGSRAWVARKRASSAQSYAGDQHAAAGRGDDLVAVERQDCGVATGAGLSAILVGCAEAFGAVDDQAYAVLRREALQRVEIGGLAVEICGHDGLGRRFSAAALASSSASSAVSTVQLSAERSKKRGVAPR